MNNVGVTELFLIFVVVLLVMGPERMVRMAAQMGHWYGYLQRQWRNARIMLQAEIDQAAAGSPGEARGETPAGDAVPRTDPGVQADDGDDRGAGAPS